MYANDHSRVILPLQGDVAGSNYFNDCHNMNVSYHDTTSAQYAYYYYVNGQKIHDLVIQCLY